MKIDGLGIADLPVMPSANDDDLLLIVQNNALKLQSYKNLTGTYSAISGSFEVDGIALPMVDASSVPPTDELVLIVENNGLAVKQVGIGAPSMPVGSFIDVDGVQIPSVRFSGNIDGDELCVAIRNNNTCLIPIPLSFSVGALPTSGRLLFAPLKSSLVLSEGTGSPTFSRATKAWRFNELGYLREVPSGCAAFHGSRLVRNMAPRSEVINAGWNLGGVTASDANTILESSGGTVHQISTATTVAGTFLMSVYLKRGVGTTRHVRLEISDSSYVARVNFDLDTGDASSTAQSGTFALISYGADSTLDSEGYRRFYVRASLSVETTATFYPARMLSALNGAISYSGDGTSTILMKKAEIYNVTSYDASYVPEYVSVGVDSAPFFGAGVDGARYYETDWQGAPIPAANLLGFRKETAATNNLLHCRDLSNAAWSTKTNITADKTATGLDGIANTATTLTATAADAIILQPITLASAARCASAYVKRMTGTGTISFTQDGGSSWTDITSQINSSTYSRVQVTSTLANPSVGFKISTSGDAIAVDVVQNEAGSVATSPIVTTTATVTRNADSLTYQTSSNWSDTAGTAFVEVAPLAYSGGAIGSATNGLLLSTSNSGATAHDGTNSANGPSGTPGASEKLALRWSGSAMSISSGGVIGTPGTYDGGMGLFSIGVGSSAAGCFRNVAIYDAAMDDSTFAAVTV